MNDLIEKLKDKKQARPYFLCTEEEQRILNKAGCEGIWMLDSAGMWGTPTRKPSAYIGQCYVLKSDYQPKPEYTDIEIKYCGTLLIADNLAIHNLVSRRNFVGFYRKSTIGDQIVSVDSIAGRIRHGDKVVARFVVE